MEFCEKRAVIPGDSLQLLRRKLYLLHYLKIIHGDIKPENIAYSCSLDEYVFIDFGLSKIIK